MKKLLLTALLLTLCVAAYSQGTVNFSNYGVVARRISYSNYPTDFIDNASYNALHGIGAAVGQYTVGLNYMRAGDTGYTLYGTTPLGYNNKAGYFNGGTATIPGTKGGDAVTLMLQVWPSAYPSFNVAEQADWYGSRSSSPFIVTLGGGSTPAAALAFTGFSIGYIPEPSTIALGLFGCLGLIFVRRRQ